jgi:hypothetical protein
VIAAPPFDDGKAQPSVNVVLVTDDEARLNGTPGASAGVVTEPVKKLEAPAALIAETRTRYSVPGAAPETVTRVDVLVLFLAEVHV